MDKFKNQNISIAVIRRLPKYYRYLEDLIDKKIYRTSSQELSDLTGFTASQIRQDLNNFGGFGQQGYGYNVIDLHEKLGNILGLDEKYNTIVVGAGNLGQAIANYENFSRVGFKIKALFDVNPDLIGKDINGIKVLDSRELEDFIKENKIEIGFITTPKDQAQGIADIFQASGIKGIWNFAPVDIQLGKDMIVENIRLNESLFVLSYFLKHDYRIY